MNRFLQASLVPLVLLVSTLNAADKESLKKTAALAPAPQEASAPAPKAEAPAPKAAAPAAAANWNVGGVSIAIPSPAADLVEIGDNLRDAMDPFVPPTNRLICAFLRESDIAGLKAGDASLRLQRYSMVEIARQVENTPVTEADFKQLVEETKKSMGESLEQIVSESNDVLREKLKNLNVGEVTVSAPKSLGTIFEKTDSYGSILLCRVQGGGQDVTMAVGIGFVRARERLLFTYLYEPYTGDDSIVHLRGALEAWTDALLAANK